MTLAKLPLIIFQKSKGVPLETSEQEQPEEIFVEITQNELCEEISENTNVPVDTVKTILASFIKHQLEIMNL